MNFKSIGLGAVATTAMVVGSVFANTPVQAMTINAGDVLGLIGSARLQNADVAVGSTSKLNFSSYTNTTSGTLLVSGASSGAFEPLALQFAFAEVKDLTLTKTATNTWVFAPATALVDFVTVAAGNVKYDLTKFTLTKEANLFTANFEGLFRSDNEVAGTGSFAPADSLTFLTNTGKGSSTSMDITAIPTPALLPGLIGLGVAALRKRKSEESGVEAAETAKA